MLSIFKKKSVHSILSVFHSCVEQLRKLADEKNKEAAKKDAQLRELMGEIEDAEAEAEAALDAADAIENLIGTGHPAFEAAAEKLA